MKRIIYIFVLILTISPSVYAEWTEEKIIHLTEEIEKTGISWSIQQTEEMLRAARNAGDYSSAMMTDKGMVRIKIIGETVLLNGRDISGNLGSKVTHGDNSPIIEDVKDSQLAIGDNAQVRGDTKTTNINIKVILILSISLSISLIFNIYLFFSKRKIKKKLTN